MLERQIMLPLVDASKGNRKIALMGELVLSFLVRALLLIWFRVVSMEGIL